MQVAFFLFCGEEGEIMLTEQLEDYIPVNMQEERDKENFISFLCNVKNPFSRENKEGHITVSAWIVNEATDKVLFCYHNIYNSWSWVGGHADNDENLIKVALREATEETGIKPTGVSEDILSIEILPVSGHIRKGEYVSSHVHYNVTYLVTASEGDVIFSQPQENSAVAWFSFKEALDKSTEPWMKENIYKKIINTMKNRKIIIKNLKK